MPSYKEKLTNILNQYGKKNYSHAVKKDPKLLKYLERKWGDYNIPELVYLEIHNENPYCSKGNRKKFKNVIEGYRDFCGTSAKCPCRKTHQSYELKDTWKKRTKDEKDNLWNKYKATSIEKYGTSSPLKNENVREKIRLTNQERYGCSSPLASKNIQLKSQCSYKVKRTIKITSGFINVSFEDLTNYTKISELESHIYNLLSFTQGLEKEIAIKGKNAIAIEYNIPPSVIDNWEERHIALARKSSFLYYYQEIQAFLRENNIKFHLEKNHIIVLLNYNLCLKLCDFSKEAESQLGNNARKHNSKILDDLEQKGYRLIILFEDEWANKKDIIKSTILHSIKQSNQKTIFARRCEVREISKASAKKFYDKNHILGGNGYSNLSLGLFNEGKIVACMSFLKGARIESISGDIQWNLTRFATDQCKVIGGASKLLKYFERTYEHDLIYTYADRRWTFGDLYFKLGFEHDHTSNPISWYIGPDYRKRFHYTTGRLNRWKKKYDINRYTEKYIMTLEGYDKVWDCGKMRFVKYRM